MSNDPTHPLVIEFPNERARRHFAAWLCGAGEQDYWSWMQCRETEEDGPITVTFRYHTGGKFLGEPVIRTTPRERTCAVDEERAAFLRENGSDDE